MRTLSSTLEAAQKSGVISPYPRVEVVDNRCGITRLDWENLYSAAVTDQWHDCCIAGDGSLIRFTGGPNRNAYVQRIIDPDEDSDYSTGWVYMTNGRQYVVSCSAQGANVILVILDSAGSGWIGRNESNDYGASWGGWSSVLTSGYTNGRISVAHKSNGDVCIIYSANNALHRIKRINGVWGSAAQWTNSLNSITGVSVVHQGDWNLIVTGTDGDDRAGVWSCILGDGYSAAVDSWTALREIMIADNTSISYSYPFLDMPDVFRFSFIEAFSGNESYARPYWTHGLPTADFINNLWREPWPMNLSSEFGISLTHDSTHNWLSRRDDVWWAPLSPPFTDLTPDLLWLNSNLEETSGEITFSVRNDDKRYSCPDSSPIKPGREIRFSPGLLTSQGADVSSGLAFWITEYGFSPQRQMYRVRATDAWGVLERWIARHQFAWADGDSNIFNLLRFVLSRAGLDFAALSTSSAVTNQYPAFTINPGQDGKSAVLRLLDMIPDVLFFRGHTGYLKNPQPSDSADYSYHAPPLPPGVSHAIRESSYVTVLPGSNRVQVFSDGVFTEEWDWDSIDDIYDRIHQEDDPCLDSTTKAHQRGEAILRDVVIHSLQGSIIAPMNCGQELYDVVEITDPHAGMDEARRRILGVRHIYDSAKGLYTITLNLGDV